MQVEGVVLTGGASRRMGRDKATLSVEGVPMAERVAQQIARHASQVTILGRRPVDGYLFLPDEEEFRGPVSALARFVPACEAVFVASCDLPAFDGAVIPFLMAEMGDHEACVPVVDGFRQPLCALYRSSAFPKLASLPADACPKDWLEALDTHYVQERRFEKAGVPLDATRGANTLAELEKLVSPKDEAKP